MQREQSSEFITVRGVPSSLKSGIVDAHNHLWIAPRDGAAGPVPQVDDHDLLVSNLVSFKEIGGSAILDAQPGAGCGRDGRRLESLSAATGVAVFACTGFHRKQYYPGNEPLFTKAADEVFDHFMLELNSGLEECRNAPSPVRAGYIKIAAADSLDKTPTHLFEAAATAAAHTGALLAVHTERGAAAEEILAALLKLKVHPEKLMLCHMDKRPDAGLHLELASSGVLLEYDTFHTPKYTPDENVWPLLHRMLAENYAGSLAIGTDMAYTSAWMSSGGNSLAERHTAIRARLQQVGCNPETIGRLQGSNILARLPRKTGERKGATA